MATFHSHHPNEQWPKPCSLEIIRGYTLPGIKDYHLLLPSQWTIQPFLDEHPWVNFHVHVCVCVDTRGCICLPSESQELDSHCCCCCCCRPNPMWAAPKPGGWGRSNLPKNIGQQGSSSQPCLISTDTNNFPVVVGETSQAPPHWRSLQPGVLLHRAFVLIPGRCQSTDEFRHGGQGAMILMAMNPWIEGPHGMYMG